MWSIINTWRKLSALQMETSNKRPESMTVHTTGKISYHKHIELVEKNDRLPPNPATTSFVHCILHLDKILGGEFFVTLKNHNWRTALIHSCRIHHMKRRTGKSKISVGSSLLLRDKRTHRMADTHKTGNLFRAPAHYTTNLTCGQSEYIAFSERPISFCSFVRSYIWKWNRLRAALENPIYFEYNTHTQTHTTVEIEIENRYLLIGSTHK